MLAELIGFISPLIFIIIVIVGIVRFIKKRKSIKNEKIDLINISHSMYGENVEDWEKFQRFTEEENVSIEDGIINSRTKVMKITRLAWIPIILSIFGGLTIFFTTVVLMFICSWYYSAKQERKFLNKSGITKKAYRGVWMEYRNRGYKR